MGSERAWPKREYEIKKNELSNRKIPKEVTSLFQLLYSHRLDFHSGDTFSPYLSHRRHHQL